MNPVLEFRGEFDFLSNFYPCRIRFAKRWWITLEHAYQAAKSNSRIYRDRVQAAPTPGKSKSVGYSANLRPDWETHKLVVMEKLLRRKFKDPVLRRKLLATGTAHLEEGNYWGDRFWGVCRGRGRNHLGRLLMKIRAELTVKTIVVNKSREGFDIYIGRPSIYGNPYQIGPDGTRAEVVRKFKTYFKERISRDAKFRSAVNRLRGQRLGCYCKPKLCHGDVYAEYLEADSGTDGGLFRFKP